MRHPQGVKRNSQGMGRYCHLTRLIRGSDSTATSTPTRANIDFHAHVNGDADRNRAGVEAPALTAVATVRGVVLSWEAAAGAVRYELATYWDAGTGWQRIGGDIRSDRHVVHTYGRCGWYRVLLFDPGGERGGGDERLAVGLSHCDRAGGGPRRPHLDADPNCNAWGRDISTPTSTPTATASALAVPALAAQATAGGVALSWGAVPNAVRYELVTLWDTGSGWSGWQPIGGNDLTGTSYTHTDVMTWPVRRIRAIQSAQ